MIRVLAYIVYFKLISFFISLFMNYIRYTWEVSLSSNKLSLKIMAFAKLDLQIKGIFRSLS